MSLDAGSITVSNTRSYRGQYAMKIHNDAAIPTIARMENDSLLSSTTTGFYARFYLYREDTALQYGAFAEALPGSGAPGFQAGLADTGKVTMLTYGPNQGDATSTGTNLIPANQWVCVEWQVSYGATTAGFMQLWVNDTAVLDFSGLNIPKLDQFFFGYGSTWEGKASNLWFDELVVDDQRIGCAN